MITRKSTNVNYRLCHRTIRIYTRDVVDVGLVSIPSIALGADRPKSEETDGLHFSAADLQLAVYSVGRERRNSQWT